MKRTVYTWMLTLLTVFGATVASADEKVSFEVKAPMVVAKGEAVRVEFSLNASPDEGSFTAPSFEGFDVIAGPAFSQGSSIQIVNGQMTRSSNYTITYVLLPQQEGNFTIGAASVRVGKSQYKTKALPIEVVEETPESSGGQQNQHHGVFDLVQEAERPGGLGRLFQLIGAVVLEPLGGLVHSEAGYRIGTQLLQHLSGGKGVPGMHESTSL